MPVTVALSDLVRVFPEGDLSIMEGLVPALNVYLPQYLINTRYRVAMFLAQWGEETDGYKTLVEYGSGKAYEGRKDLGNIYPGDGPRYKGRGLCQLTGRDNYAYYGQLLGIDLVGNPDLMLQPEVGVRVACLFWQHKGINNWADRGDVSHVTYLINGGENGLSRRENNYTVLMTILQPEAAPIPMPRPDRPSVPAPAQPAPAPAPVPAPAPEVPQSPSGPIATGPTPPIWQTPEGGMLGTAVIGQLGAIISGASGPLAWALAAVVVIAIIVAAWYFIKRLHKGQ